LLSHLGAIISSRIKIAQHWCKSVVFPNTQKSNSNKMGPLIAKQHDWEEKQVLL
jgi:hypothetical protein